MIGLGLGVGKGSVYGSSGGVTYIAASTFSLQEASSTGSVVSVVTSQADDNGVTKTDVVKLVAGQDLLSSNNVFTITSSGISDLVDGSTVNATYSFYYPSANVGDTTGSICNLLVGSTTGSANKISGSNTNLGEWNTVTGTLTVGSSTNTLLVEVDDAGGGSMKEDDEFYLAEVRVF